MGIERVDSLLAVGACPRSLVEGETAGTFADSDTEEIRRRRGLVEELVVWDDRREGESVGEEHVSVDSCFNFLRRRQLTSPD